MLAGYFPEMPQQFAYPSAKCESSLYYDSPTAIGHFCTTKFF